MLVPMIFLGISTLFDAGTVGEIFGGVVLVLIAALVGAFVYWYREKGGKMVLMETFVPEDKLSAYLRKCEKEKEKAAKEDQSTIHMQAAATTA